jgi:uncharacterized protein (UPF0548 family)
VRLVAPLARAPGLDALADWERRPVWPGVASGPDLRDHRDAFERVVGREPPGPPLADGPLRRAAAAILAYRVFPAWLLTPVLRRAPLEAGDTVGAVYHPLGPRLGGIFFASRVARRFDGVSDDGRAWEVGFTYRTLEGHPELGEETFSVEKDLATGEVQVALRSWSRPGLMLSRALRPIVRLLQVRGTEAALTALARSARGDDRRFTAGPPLRRRLRHARAGPSAARP